MDYDSLIDAETWAFIRDTATYYPEDATDRSIEEQRRVYNTMCRAFHRGYPHGIAASDQSAEGVPVRIYSAGEPGCTVIYFHGGGFILGGLDSHDDVCAEICAGTGYRVVSVDYRLAPEHPHPAAFQDSWQATLWAAGQYDGNLVLAGDSAGGNLAAAVAHHARARLRRIAGQVLIYPALGGDSGRGSYLDHAGAPMLTRDDVLYYSRIRCNGPTPHDDPSFAPLQDRDFSKLPPTVIFSAQCDPISDDGRAYRDRLIAAGGHAYWVNEPGLVHGYLRARGMATRAGESFERIVLAIEALGQGLWPYD